CWCPSTDGLALIGCFSSSRTSLKTCSSWLEKSRSAVSASSTEMAPRPISASVSVFRTLRLESMISYIFGWGFDGSSVALWPRRRWQLMSSTTYVLATWRYFTARLADQRAAFGSAPVTCNAGAYIVLEPSVEYCKDRECSGAGVKPSRLFITTC